MIPRTLIVLVLLALAGIYAARAGAVEDPAPRVSLSELPLAFASYEGRDAAPLQDDVVAQLGVDDYVHRQYWSASGASVAPIGVYAGYYASQRQGDTIHSPQNCLPGAGWQPVSSGTVDVETPGRVLTVNRYVIQKGLDRQVVFYWYQGRGRVIASEYANKALLMFDAATTNRTSGGLVRVLTPVVTTAEAATGELRAFVQAFFPHLDKHLP